MSFYTAAAKFAKLASIRKQKITDHLDESDDFSILTWALDLTGLGKTLNELSKITLFAPTNDAFGRLAQDLGFYGDESKPEEVKTFLIEKLETIGPASSVLSEILLYHVSTDRLKKKMVPYRDEIPTLNGKSITPDGFKLQDEASEMANPQLISGNWYTKNGVINVIDRVLLPFDLPNERPETIVIEAEEFELTNYEVLESDAATGGELISLTEDNGKAEYTFEGETGEYDIEIFYFDERDGVATIQMDVGDENIFTTRLWMSPGGYDPSSKNRASVIVENVKIENGEVITLNGSRHLSEFAAIDRIELTPKNPGPPTLLDLIQTDANLSILRDAIDLLELQDIFEGLDGTTVFAPDNTAFLRLAEDLGYTGDPGAEYDILCYILVQMAERGQGVANFSNILIYHVSPGEKSAAALENFHVVNTLLGQATIGTDGGELLDNEPTLDNPTITGPDMEAVNGLMHVIDRVLLPDTLFEPVPQSAPTGYIGFDHTFAPDAPDEFFDITFSQQVNTLGTEQDNTFWSSDFAFAGSEQEVGGQLESGYLGLQKMPDGGEGDLALFSIFVAEEANALNDDAFVVQGQELGTGFYSVRLYLDFSQGAEYKFNLSQEVRDTGTWWVTSYTVDGGPQIEIGEIRVADDWGGVASGRVGGFIELFGEQDSCDDIRFSETVYGNAVADGYLSDVSAHVYGDCEEEVRKRTDITDTADTVMVNLVDADSFDFI